MSIPTQRSRKSRLPLLLVIALLPLSMILASCASSNPPTPTTVTVPDCVNWKDISYSADTDSQATINQIIRSNAARDAVCTAADHVSAKILGAGAAK